jgi:ACR3 family arsenite efflux pump ArsB
MKSNTILGDLTLSLSLFIPLILFYTVNAFISHIISVKFLGRKEGIAFVYSILLRNLTIALAVTVSISSDSMAVLLIALANIVQHPIAALYLKFANSKKVSNRYVVAIEK